MKFNFLQGDFSSGELSPRAQGHADSESYKAGLRLASNVAPTRAGSIASRAGLEFLLAGINGNTGAPSNLPVQHIPIHDGPYGDIVLEVSPTGIRLLDKSGVLPWNFPPSSEFVQYTAQDGSFAYADSKERKVYLRSEVASGARSYYLSKADPTLGIGGAQNAVISAPVLLTVPAGTDETWILSGKIAGDSVTAHIVQSNPAHFQDIAVAPDVNGNFSITFRPNIGGADEAFYIQLITTAATTATTLWNLTLTKNAVKVVQDTTAFFPPPTFGGVGVATTQERVRAVGFWTQGDFWIPLAGGPSNQYSTFALRWTPGVPGPPPTAKWTFGTLPCTTNSLAQIQGANAVAVFQDRVWYGINLTNGKRVIRASVAGFGRSWGYNAQAGSTGAARPNGVKDFLFQFIVETETTVAVPIGTGVIAYSFPCGIPNAELHVTVAGKLAYPTADFTVAGHTFDYETARPSQYQYLKMRGESDLSIAWNYSDALKYVPANATALADQDLNPGGSIFFSTAGGAGIIAISDVKITRVAQATDPLDLNLASPNGKIAWINVLRGLMLGTTRNEKLFSDGLALAIDPATGASFELRDESSYGADPALPALDINEHVLFVQRGRKVLRQAGINISSNGGLVSEDVGIAGEHLTKARIRSMCYLKSPVQRVVFAFDDGTGAVMTLVNRGTGLNRMTVPAFTRFTIPACFGGIYSVVSLDSENDSELWIGTENGVTLRAVTFESDIAVKEVQLLNAAPAAPTHLQYDTESPLPVVMDSWARSPLVNQGGSQYATGLPLAAVGQNVYALASGQLYGPYVVAAGGKVVFPANTLDKTWVDASGARRAQEVYVGIPFAEHRWTSLPLQGGNPVGSSQNLKSRKQQLHLRFVDSYLPKVNGKRMAERGGADPTDLLGARVTGDLRVTEEGFQQGAVVDVVMDLPLRMEVSAIHGGVVMNNI